MAAIGRKAIQPTRDRLLMGWNIYRLETRAVVVRREEEDIEGCFEFVREATESEVEDELVRRKISKDRSRLMLTPGLFEYFDRE
jgi:hypothetical protein